MCRDHTFPPRSETIQVNKRNNRLPFPWKADLLRARAPCRCLSFNTFMHRELLLYMYLGDLVKTHFKNPSLRECQKGKRRVSWRFQNWICARHTNKVQVYHTEVLWPQLPKPRPSWKAVKETKRPSTSVVLASRPNTDSLLIHFARLFGKSIVFNVFLSLHHPPGKSHTHGTSGH